ncbi:GNAT family N-acetyltransferase [cyanobacterium TDX16]|nr:GNAT family N-acetyltransferase [cyanobacterium TDX16]
MSDTSDAVVVTDVPDQHRYEARIDGDLMGIAEYRLGDGQITFTHTEVADAAEGKGVGGRLVRTALDEARARGLRVRPQCPFVRSYIEKHPEYADLVAAG